MEEFIETWAKRYVRINVETFFNGMLRVAATVKCAPTTKAGGEDFMCVTFRVTGESADDVKEKVSQRLQTIESTIRIIELAVKRSEAIKATIDADNNLKAVGHELTRAVNAASVEVNFGERYHDLVKGGKLTSAEARALLKAFPLAEANSKFDDRRNYCKDTAA